MDGRKTGVNSLLQRFRSFSIRFWNPWLKLRITVSLQNLLFMSIVEESGSLKSFAGYKEMQGDTGLLCTFLFMPRPLSSMALPRKGDHPGRGQRDGEQVQTQHTASSFLSMVFFGIKFDSIFLGELPSVKDRGKGWMTGNCQLSFSDQILTEKHQQEG